MTTTTGEGLRIEVPPCTTVGEGEDPLAVETSVTKAQEAAHSTPRTGSGGRRRKVKTAAAVQ